MDSPRLVSRSGGIGNPRRRGLDPRPSTHVPQFVSRRCIIIDGGRSDTRFRRIRSLRRRGLGYERGRSGSAGVRRASAMDGERGRARRGVGLLLSPGPDLLRRRTPVEDLPPAGETLAAAGKRLIRSHSVAELTALATRGDRVLAALTARRARRPGAGLPAVPGRPPGRGLRRRPARVRPRSGSPTWGSSRPA